jgi:hypothetical protein
VAVEKLLAVKITKTKLRQDAPQTTSSIFLDILYPPNFGYLGGTGTFSTATPVNDSNVAKWIGIYDDVL